MNRRSSPLFLLLIVVACGCGRALPPGDRCVTSILNERLGKTVYWNRGNCNAPSVCQAISYLLGQELTVDSAVQIALLNNPEIQAIFDEIGIAHADLIEAGLFRNPLFEGYVRFPNQPLSINTQFSIAQTFLDIFLVPLRKKIAAAEYERIKLGVANEILELAFAVQKIFYRYVAVQKKVALLRLLADATDVANQLAILQRQRGNINDLEQQVHTNEYLEAKAEYTRGQIELVRLREDVNRLLGLSSFEICWCITEDLPNLPQEELPGDCLERIALSQRLDVVAARWELERLNRVWRTKQWWAYADGRLGASSEKDAEGFRVTGPAFSLPIPFFNYGQADRARVRALYAQNFNRLRTLEIAVLSEVRSARDRLIIQRQLVLEYRNQLLPLQELIVSTSQHFYNYMALGVYRLINSKKQEIRMGINYNMALLDYWITRVEVDRSLGGGLHYAIANFDASCGCGGEPK